MATISASDGYYTTISVFTTKPENQQRLFEVISAGEEQLKGFPGLVSGSVHLSHDGTKVVGYAQWEKPEDFDAMRAQPGRQGHFQEVRELVTDVDLIACRVAYTHENDGIH
ncbi:antibiotic biosynthesis monooxygenase [Nonomuraea sp. NPDC003804]|uniref:antibiotic biosynthesis monooxygenase family protein n=1 Tax=Nonomuraea sp. NPDC003804 TaxID=3154547 RepID=UPI0033B8F2F5